MKYKDYYQTLGVARGAGDDEIKRAYRRLARRFHPDVSSESDAEARFKEVGEAYEVLKDADKRAGYDQLGSSWRDGDEFRRPPGWSANFESGRSGANGAFDVSDFFESLFGAGGRRRAGGGRGRDERLSIQVSLEDAFRGGERTLRLRRTGGPSSGGPQTLKVKIPAGVTQGQQIRLAGQGQDSPGGGTKGDLYLEVQMLPHRLYRVDGKDLYLDVPVTPWEAALGAVIEVPTLGGAVDLTIPAGSRSGRTLRLKGRGLGGKASRDETAGNQYIVLQIVAPPADSEAAKEAYQRMAREMPFNPRDHWGA